jgi:hypothetical protein
MDEKEYRKASTGTYRVRGVSRDLHRAARLRAASQGTTLRWVILQAFASVQHVNLDTTGRTPGAGHLGHVQTILFEHAAWLTPLGVRTDRVGHAIMQRSAVTRVKGQTRVELGALSAK